MNQEPPKWAQTILNYRWPVLIFVGVILTGIFAYGVSIMSVRVILEDMFPFGHPFVKLHKEFGSQFGGASTTVIEVKTTEGDIFNPTFLQKIKEITDAVTFRDDVYSLLTASISLSKMKYIRGYSGGRVEMDGLMWPKMPRTPEELAFMKENIFTSPLYNEVFVNDEGTATLIIAEFKEGIDYGKVFDFFMDLKDKYEDDTTRLYIIGKPVLLGYIYSYRPQMILIFAVSIAILMFFLFSFFHMWQGAVVPVVTALLSAVWGFGILGFVQVNLSPLLFVLVFIVGARALGQSIQMTQRYFEELNRWDGVRRSAAARTMSALLVPGFSAILTDAAGFAVCYLIGIILMQQLAIALTIWMCTIFILTGIFAPVLCSCLSRPKPEMLKKFKTEGEMSTKPGWLERFNVTLASLAMGRAGVVIIVAYVALYAFGIYRVPKVPVGDPTPGSPILWEDTEYNLDYDEINRTFAKAGADNYIVFFRGTEEFGAKRPEVYQTFEALDRFMAVRMPDVYGGSWSLAPVIKKLNKEMHDGSPLWEFIPDEEGLCTSMLFLFQSKAVPGDLDRYADPNFYNTNTVLFFKDHTEETINRIKVHMKEFFETFPQQLDFGEFLLAGGVIGMETAVNEEISALHAKVDGLVLATIFLMCTVAYRSPLAGFLLCVPLLLANLLAFGYMSFANMGFTINTLPCAAVGVGVGVDFGLFIFSRMREEITKSGGDWELALKTTARTASKGVVYTALSMILPCLAWWLLPSLKFQAQMGLFLAIVLSFNMISALILHPALIYRIKPKFIYRPAK